MGFPGHPPARMNNTPRAVWGPGGRPWPGSEDPFPISPMDQLPDLVKALALSALSFHICALRPLLAGIPFESLFEHFYLQDKQGSLYQPPQIKVLISPLLKKFSLFLNGTAVCPHDFGLHRVDGGIMSHLASPRQQSCLSLLPPGGGGFRCRPLYSPSPLYSPPLDCPLCEGTNWFLFLYPQRAWSREGVQ